MTNDAAPELPMDVEPQAAATTPAVDCDDGAGSKRSRDENDDQELVQNEDKRSKIEPEIDNSANGNGNGDGASVGPKSFGSAVEMFDYFFKLLRTWPANLDLNKYEHLVVMELLKKGHLEAERKIGKGVKSFQVRFHPQYKSRCFFLIRDDESIEDFSFRKCVDHILPLPENMQVKHDSNKGFRGRGGGRGRGRGRGHGRR